MSKKQLIDSVVAFCKNMETIADKLDRIDHKVHSEITRAHIKNMRDNLAKARGAEV